MSETARPELVVVGFDGWTHVGDSFMRAAQDRGIPARLCDAQRAYNAPRWVTRFNWHLRGHRPTHLRAFSRSVVEACEQARPRWLLTTGIAPLDAASLRAIGALGVQRINFLTDDPWNRRLGSRWFFEAVREYDVVFSPRRSNLEDLRRHGCGRVEYLPFGYEPRVFYPQPLAGEEEVRRFTSDVVFAGAADDDRVPIMNTLIRAGLDVHLYGGYWHRYRETRAAARGYADPETLRRSIAGARVCVCLVRRANRDGHAMRTYELPAASGCMLVEQTDEHREIFGEEGRAVLYFRNRSELVEKTRALVADAELRARLAAAACALIRNGRNTYADRLDTALGLPGAHEPTEPSFARATGTH